MTLTLINKIEEVSNVTSFVFKPDTNVDWKAGQYMKYILDDPNPDERSTIRYFTIASAPHEKNLILTTKFVPDDGSTFKKDLKNLKIGSRIQAEGPWGEFTTDDPQKQYVFISEGKKLCFIAGGIGITPFRSILLDLDHNNLPINVVLLYANRDQNIIYKEELEKLLLNHPNFKIHYFIDPQRIDQQTIRTTNYELLTTNYYISGPKPMVQAMKDMLVGTGVPQDQIKQDFFPGYEEI